MNLHKIIEITFALAGKYQHNKRCRHFSFIFEKQRLLSIGINNPKTHPLNLRYNYINKQRDKISEMVGTHSELNAVIKLGLEDCSGFTMVNTRINRNNKLDYSYPCNGCMDMIKKYGFKKIIYSTKDQVFASINTEELYEV
jgi:deoxycytidylate deaminase